MKSLMELEVLFEQSQIQKVKHHVLSWMKIEKVARKEKIIGIEKVWRQQRIEREMNMINT